MRKPGNAPRMEPVRSEHLWESRLLNGMSPVERARLGPHLEPITVESRQSLARTGEPLTHLFFPTDAVTSTLTMLPEGETVEVGLMGAEGVVGLPVLYGDRISLNDVIVQIPGHAVRIAV